MDRGGEENTGEERAFRGKREKKSAKYFFQLAGEKTWGKDVRGRDENSRGSARGKKTAGAGGVAHVHRPALFLCATLLRWPSASYVGVPALFSRSPPLPAAPRENIGTRAVTIAVLLF